MADFMCSGCGMGIDKTEWIDDGICEYCVPHEDDCECVECQPQEAA